MTIRIEDIAFEDARYELLGHLAGYNHHEALGRMARLWQHCTKKFTDVVSEAVIKAHLGPSGVEAILESELGERADGGIRVAGCKGRIEWYESKVRAAKAGGKARAKTGDRGNGGQFGSGSSDSSQPATGQPRASQNPATGQPRARESPGKSSPSVSVSAPGTTCQGPKGGDDGASPRSGQPGLELSPEEPPAPKPQRKPRGNPDVGRVRDWWRERYRDEYGCEATWGQKQNGQARQLLSAHGLEEVQRRGEILLSSPPPWLKGPYDFGTLVQHFDKLAQPSDAAKPVPRGLGGDRNADHVDKAAAKARELRRQGI